MKKKDFIWMLLISCIFFACKEIGMKNKNLQACNPKKLTVDFVIEEDSTQILDSVIMKYSSKILLFPDLNDNKILKSIYDDKNIKDFSKNGLQKFLVDQKNNIVESIRNSKKYSDLAMQKQLKYTSQMNVKMNRNNYLHIQYYDCRTDGKAIDQYKYKEKVFDLKDNKKMQISDITSLSHDELENLLKTNLERTTMMQQMEKYDQKGYAVLSSLSIPVTSNFYFDDNNLYFHYNMNELTKAYDIGDIIIPISFDDLEQSLNQNFRLRMKIK